MTKKINPLDGANHLIAEEDDWLSLEAANEEDRYDPAFMTMGLVYVARTRELSQLPNSRGNDPVRATVERMGPMNNA